MKYIILLVILIFCFADISSSKPLPKSIYNNYFEIASSRYNIPVEIIKTIGYVESHWKQRPDKPSRDNGFGIMHLTDNQTNNSLMLSSVLTGFSINSLKTSAEANILGGTAILHFIAKQYFANNSFPKDLSQWVEIIKNYSFLKNDLDKNEYSNQVYKYLINGIRGYGDDNLPIVLPSQQINDSVIFQSRLTRSTPDYPSAVWDPSPNYTTAGISQDYIIIHDTEGGFAGSVNWLTSTVSDASCHYILRSSDGYIKQLVEEQNRAWHAVNFNPYSIGLEHEGYESDPSYYTYEMYHSSALLCRYLCNKYSIPKDRLHLLGHDDLPLPNTHTDPGQYWNWNFFIASINGITIPFEANVVTTPSPIIMTSGDILVFYIDYQSTTDAPWDTNNTRLGTSIPRNRISSFYDSSNWISITRPTSADIPSFHNGTTVKFTFTLKAPVVASTSIYNESFELIQEGQDWFTNNTQVTLNITVIPNVITSTITGTSIISASSIVSGSNIISNTSLVAGSSIVEATNITSGTSIVIGTSIETGVQFAMIEGENAVVVPIASNDTSSCGCGSSNTAFYVGKKEIRIAADFILYFSIIYIIRRLRKRLKNKY